MKQHPVFRRGKKAENFGDTVGGNRQFTVKGRGDPTGNIHIRQKRIGFVVHHDVTIRKAGFRGETIRTGFQLIVAAQIDHGSQSAPPQLCNLPFFNEPGVIGTGNDIAFDPFAVVTAATFKIAKIPQMRKYRFHFTMLLMIRFLCELLHYIPIFTKNNRKS